LGHWGHCMRAGIGRHRYGAYPLAKAVITIAYIGLTPTRYRKRPIGGAFCFLFFVLCLLSLSRIVTFDYKS
jgi:hypothetical protein